MNVAFAAKSLCGRNNDTFVASAAQRRRRSFGRSATLAHQRADLVAVAAHQREQ